MNQVMLDAFVCSVVISCRYLGRSLSIKIALSRTCSLSFRRIDRIENPTDKQQKQQVLDAKMAGSARGIVNTWKFRL